MRVLSRHWKGSRSRLKRLVAAHLRGRNRAFLLQLVRRHAFAIAVATALLSHVSAEATSPIDLSDISMVANAGGFILNGEADNNYSGQSVSIAGDINGDGTDDLVVGAPRAGTTGKVYVVFGQSGGTGIDLTDVGAGTPGFVINGISTYDGAGGSVSGAGDVNGDGLMDVVIGAGSVSDGMDYNIGEAYVVFGKASTTAVDLSDVLAGTESGFAITGREANDYTGDRVSGAGDINGDGLDDVIIGARGADPGGRISAGKAYVIFGKASPAVVDLFSLGAKGFVLNGIDAGDRAGGTVSGAGDVNGDGLADMIVGAPRANRGVDNYAGEAYVVFGRTATTNLNLSLVSSGFGGFLIQGASFYDTAGGAVSGSGDVNGDGLADVLVAASGATTAGKTNAGVIGVVFGKTSGSSVDLADIYTGTDGFIIKGEKQFDRAGRSAANAGDVDGDGLSDVLVGTTDADPNAYSSAGRSYVVFGKTSGTAVELTDIVAGTGGFVVNGIAANDYSGTDVGGAGDVDGDGLPDMVVGAPLTDEGSYIRSGDAYVVFNPETVPGSATYKGKSRAGDGAGGAIVPATTIADARLTIDFSDEDNGTLSLETVTLFRSNATISNFPGNAADVAWQFATNRSSWSATNLTVKAVVPELAGLTVAESNLALFTAFNAAGPWVKHVTTADADKNKWSINVGSFASLFLALGELNTTWADFAFGGASTGFQGSPYKTLQDAVDNVADGGTINIKGDTGISVSSESLIISKPVTINAVNGTVTIGAP